MTRRQYCTFHLDPLLFGIEVQQVQEVIRCPQMTRVPQAPDVIGGLVNLRGQIVTVIDLRRRLGLPGRPVGQPPMNVVVRGDDGAVSFLVDRIGEVLEVEVDKFEMPPQTLRDSARLLVQGAYKLDGQLLLVLNTHQVACPTAEDAAALAS